MEGGGWHGTEGMASEQTKKALREAMLYCDARNKLRHCCKYAYVYKAMLTRFTIEASHFPLFCF